MSTTLTLHHAAGIWHSIMVFPAHAGGPVIRAVCATAFKLWHGVQHMMAPNQWCVIDVSILNMSPHNNLSCGVLDRSPQVFLIASNTAHAININLTYSSLVSFQQMYLITQKVLSLVILYLHYANYSLIHNTRKRIRVIHTCLLGPSRVFIWSWVSYSLSSIKHLLQIQKHEGLHITFSWILSMACLFSGL